MKSTHLKPRLSYLESLSILSSFAVVMLHANGVVHTINPNSGRLWFTSNIIETVFYFAVPCFFMITGVTLFDYSDKYDDKTFFCKRMRKTVIPFLIWSLVFLLYGWLQRGEQISSLSQAISIILNTSSYNNIFWFFLPLIAIYLSIPVFSRITDKYRIFSYMIWLGIIFVFSLPTFCRLTGITFNGALVPPVVSGYMVYPALGYVFNQTNFTKCHRIMIYLSGILGWALMFFGIIILSDESGTNTLFKGYLNFPAALQAIAVFVWVKYNLSSIPNKIKPLIHKISQATFGVYCMHELFILEIPRLFHINNSSILFRTIGAVLIFFLCIGLTFVLQKIPLVKNAVPK